jgi:hypothetical protein
VQSERSRRTVQSTSHSPHATSPGCRRVALPQSQALAKSVRKRAATEHLPSPPEAQSTYRGTIRAAEVAWHYQRNATLECNKMCLPHPCISPTG